MAYKTKRQRRAIEIAKELYNSASIEVTDPASTSTGDDGVWVRAWVFVPNDQIERVV
jgi:hypothetical protein